MIGQDTSARVDAMTPPIADGDMLAAIDLGSNSFHMIVARYTLGQLRVVDRLRETVRMAEGLDTRGGLTAEVRQRALACLSRDDLQGFHDILAPTVPLSRHIFKAPTRFYKTGVVFMAWLNGHQDHFTMVGGQQSARSIGHFVELFRLADKAGLLRDPDLAAARMRQILAVHGVS